MMCMIIQRSIMLLITDMVRPGVSHAVCADFRVELGKRTSCTSMLYQRVSPFCTNIGDRGIFEPRSGHLHRLSTLKMLSRCLQQHCKWYRPSTRQDMHTHIKTCIVH